MVNSKLQVWCRCEHWYLDLKKQIRVKSSGKARLHEAMRVAKNKLNLPNQSGTGVAWGSCEVLEREVLVPYLSCKPFSCSLDQGVNKPAGRLFNAWTSYTILGPELWLIVLSMDLRENDNANILM